MQSIRLHVSRCLVAGIVALLPLGGVIFTVVYMEYYVAQLWPKEYVYYFFGLGLVVAVAAIYVIGLLVSSIFGRWLWNLVDRLLDRLPLLGNLYQTLKQIIGYGEGPNAIFRRVVLIPSRDLDGDEIGLVTREATEGAEKKLTVFVPSAPTPTSGRLVLIEAAKVRPIDMSVSDALKTLVSMGTIETG